MYETLFCLPELKLKIIQCKIPGLWNRGSVLYQAKIFTSILLLSQGGDNRHCKAPGINLLLREPAGVFISHLVFPLLNKGRCELRVQIWPDFFFLMWLRMNEVWFFFFCHLNDKTNRREQVSDRLLYQLFSRDYYNCALQPSEGVWKVG